MDNDDTPPNNKGQNHQQFLLQPAEQEHEQSQQQPPSLIHPSLPIPQEQLSITVPPMRMTRARQAALNPPPESDEDDDDEPAPLIQRRNPNAKLKTHESQKGPWSPQEDDLLRRLVDREGASHWSNIAAYIPGRAGKQCRERWVNFLDPALSKGPWSDDEDALLGLLIRKYNKKWSLMAKIMKENGFSRTDNAIKNRWNSSQRRQQELLGEDQQVEQKYKIPTSAKKQVRQVSRDQLAQQQAAALQTDYPNYSQFESDEDEDNLTKSLTTSRQYNRDGHLVVTTVTTYIKSSQDETMSLGTPKKSRNENAGKITAPSTPRPRPAPRVIGGKNSQRDPYGTPKPKSTSTPKAFLPTPTTTTTIAVPTSGRGTRTSRRNRDGDDEEEPVFVELADPVMLNTKARRERAQAAHRGAHNTTPNSNLVSHMTDLSPAPTQNTEDTSPTAASQTLQNVHMLGLQHFTPAKHATSLNPLVRQLQAPANSKYANNTTTSTNSYFKNLNLNSTPNKNSTTNTTSSLFPLQDNSTTTFQPQLSLQSPLVNTFSSAALKLLQTPRGGPVDDQDDSHDLNSASTSIFNPHNRTQFNTATPFGIFPSSITMLSSDRQFSGNNNNTNSSSTTTTRDIPLTTPLKSKPQSNVSNNLFPTTAHNFLPSQHALQNQTPLISDFFKSIASPVLPQSTSNPIASHNTTTTKSPHKLSSFNTTSLTTTALTTPRQVHQNFPVPPSTFIASQTISTNHHHPHNLSNHNSINQSISNTNSSKTNLSLAFTPIQPQLNSQSLDPSTNKQSTSSSTSLAIIFGVGNSSGKPLPKLPLPLPPAPRLIQSKRSNPSFETNPVVPTSSTSTSTSTSTTTSTSTSTSTNALSHHITFSHLSPSTSLQLPPSLSATPSTTASTTPPLHADPAVTTSRPTLHKPQHQSQQHHQNVFGTPKSSSTSTTFPPNLSTPFLSQPQSTTHFQDDTIIDNARKFMKTGTSLHSTTNSQSYVQLPLNPPEPNSSSSLQQEQSLSTTSNQPFYLTTPLLPGTLGTAYVTSIEQGNTTNLEMTQK